MDILSKSLSLHKKLQGKLSVESKIKIKSKLDLSLVYTPGVAEACRRIYKNKKKSYDYTGKKNAVAIVTDGSAVLGLGDIGPEAALPVMEGKAVLFKEFGGIDAYPVCLGTKNTGEIVNIVKKISSGFGGINLEDISAPRCFEIEKKLNRILNIPVFHDDQHGTAIVVLAGLINAAKVVGKNIKKLKIIINGAGAAGIAVAKILINQGLRHIVLIDSKGAIYYCRGDLSKIKKDIAALTNAWCRSMHFKKTRQCSNCIRRGLKEAIKGTDVFIGVSVPGILSQKMVEEMNKDPIIFAMANPIPEIMPDKAKAAGAKIIATGRSDFPNQINNVLAFPGIFRGALDIGAKNITERMKTAAAYALANYIKLPTPKKIIPSVLDREVTHAVACAVKTAVKK